MTKVYMYDDRFQKILDYEAIQDGGDVWVGLPYPYATVDEYPYATVDEMDQDPVGNPYALTPERAVQKFIHYEKKQMEESQLACAEAEKVLINFLNEKLKETN